jgi:hypothetical protein
MARSNFAEVATRATPRRTNRWQNEWKPLRCLTQNQFNFGFRVEWSDTLAAGSWSTETVNQQITSTQGALETVKASVSKGNGGKRFMRLRVARP